MDRSDDEYAQAASYDVLERDYPTNEGSLTAFDYAGMKAPGDDAEPVRSTVRYVDGARDLAAIRRPDVELAIWVRCPPNKFTTWLSALTFEQLPDLRILVKPEDLAETLRKYLNLCNMPSGDMRDYLIGDIDDLVHTFADITECEAVDVRLERISHDACWRFHRDRVDARLLVTYLGPGTEWVEPQHADAAVAEQNDYTGPVAGLRTFDVGLFTGSMAEDGGGVVHRSPPVMELGLTRLLLCLNKPSITSPEPLA